MSKEKEGGGSVKGRLATLLAIALTIAMPFLPRLVRWWKGGQRGEYYHG